MLERPVARNLPLWLGANFWSRAGGPLMWRHYDPDLVREELRVLRDHGLTMTRSFCYWPDFQPEPEVIDETLCERYRDFLDAHTELGMTTIPTFIVGHMSGQNWSPAWRGGRSIYSDIWMVGRTAWYITEVTRRLADHAAVGGWLVSNEIPIFAGNGSADVVQAWSLLMVNAVRAGGGHQPVSIGDGAWGLEVTGADNGFRLADAPGLVDFVGPHVYRTEIDPVRQHLNAAFVCELAGTAGLPVVMEEFGVTTDFTSYANAGHYYRQLLVNTLLAGAHGWMAWNNTDYDDLFAQPPYANHPFEMHFGITDHRGNPKPPLLEMAAFAKLLEQVDVAHCDRVPAEVGLVVSSFLDQDYEIPAEGNQSGLVAEVAHQAHATLRSAGLPTAVVREARDGGLQAGAALYLLASARELCAPSWDDLLRQAEGGATVWASYCAGETDWQRGPWWFRMRELFGVSNALTYGLNERVDGEVEFTFERDFGSITAGERLVFPVAGSEHARARLAVEVHDGEVVARDAQGNPAIVVREVGSGRGVLCTYPIEYFALRRPGANPDDTQRIYRALAEVAGIEVPVVVDDPQVLVDGLRHRDGREFWFLVSQHPDEVEVTPRGDGLLRLDGGPVGTVRLAPFGVEVLVRTPEGAAPPAGA